MSDSYGMQRWVSFYNDSGETIPSYALLMFVSDKGTTSVTANFSRRLRARQYTTDGAFQYTDQGIYALNSRAQVPHGKYGKCNFAIDAPAFARIRDVDVPSVNLDADEDWIELEYGPITDKWSIGPDGSGFRLLSRPQKLTGTNYHRVLVMQNSGGDDMLLFTSAETTTVLGGVTGHTGVATTGIAYLVPPGAHNTPSTADIDFDAEHNVDLSQLSALVFPNLGNAHGLLPQYTFWAVKRNGVYFAVSGGATAFEGTVSDPGLPCLITPEWTGNDVEATPLFSETLIADQEVKCEVKGNEIIVGNAGCVPVD